MPVHPRRREGVRGWAVGYTFSVGDRVRLVKPVNLPDIQGPAVGSVGVVVGVGERGGADDRETVLRVLFESFSEQLATALPIGVWIVSPDEVEASTPDRK